jgi:hypothetical protein
MNNNIKSIKYTNIEKTIVKKNFDNNCLLELLDLDDSDSYCELEFVNYGKNEIKKIINDISNNIKTLTKNNSYKSDNLVLDDVSENIENDDNDNSPSCDYIDISDDTKELFRYRYNSDYEDNIVICLQPVSNKIVIAIINMSNISETQHYYALYSSGNEYGNSIIVYGYIGRFIEFYAENFIDCDPSIAIFCSTTKKQIATNIKKLDFIKQSLDMMFHIDDVSFWKLYFLLGPEYFSENYLNEDDFNLYEIIPNKTNVESMYSFYENITFKITSDTKIIEHLNGLVCNDGKLNTKEWRKNLKSYLPNSIINYVLDKLDAIEAENDRH